MRVKLIVGFDAQARSSTAIAGVNHRLEIVLRRQPVTWSMNVETLILSIERKHVNHLTASNGANSFILLFSSTLIRANWINAV